MDDEELARLQKLIDEHEAATGERSPLRDVLEAQKAQRADLTNLVAPMPEVSPAFAPQVKEPESRLSPPPPMPTRPEEPTPQVEEPESRVSPPPEVAEPESRISPPREEPGLAVPGEIPTSPSAVLRSLLFTSASAAEGPPQKPISTGSRAEFARQMGEYDKAMAAWQRREVEKTLLTPAEPKPQRELPPMPTYGSANDWSTALSDLGAPFEFGVKATDPLRRFTAGAAGTVAKLPWDVAAGLESLSAIGKGYRYGEDSPEAKLAQANVAWLQTQGLGAQKSVKAIAGVSGEPVGLVAKGAEIVGESFTPIKGYTIATTGALAGLQSFIHASQPESPALPPEVAKYLLPLKPPDKPVQRGVSIDEPKGEPAKDFAKRLEEWKTEVFGGPMKRPVMPRPRKTETDAQFGLRMAEYERRDALWLNQITPTAKATIETVGGEMSVKPSNLWGVGIMGLVSVGMIAAPPVYRLFKDTILPKPMMPSEVSTRSVKIPGITDVVTVTSPLDVFRAVGDDINLAATRLATKAMMDPAKIERIDNLLRTQTRGQGQSLINSAIENGQLQGSTLRFEAPVSLARMEQIIKNTPNATEYLVIRDVAEELNVRSQLAKHMPNATTADVEEALGHNIPGTMKSEAYGPAGPPIVQGLNLDEANAMMWNYEKSQPELIQVGKMWTDWNKERYRFEGEGEAAIRPQRRTPEQDPGKADRSVEYLMEQRPNAVPWMGKRSKDMSFEDRVSHTDIVGAMNYHTRTGLGKRMDNEAHLLIVDEFRELNPNYFWKIEDEVAANGAVTTAKERLNNHPEWEPFVQRVFRRGEEELYLTDPTFRDLLKFDLPTITGQAGNILYATKRLIESNYTGALNPAFAPTNALRVWHTAKFTVKEGRVPPTLYGMASDVPKTLYPQIAKYFVNAMDEVTGARWSQYLPKTAREAIGMRLASAADDAMYAAITHGGGAHGSTLEQSIRAARLDAATADFQKLTGPLAVMAKRFWAMYKPLLGAVHEAPMNAYVRANAGRAPIPTLLAEGRDLGGDPKITGQYYTVDPRTGARAPIQYQTDNALEKAIITGIRGYGLTMELGRTAGTWTNAIVQSVKRFGAAYLENPGKFVANMWLYTMLPAGVQSMWNHSIGTDPNGRRYADYQMNGRHQYNTLTSWYLGLPGHPAEDGVEISGVALEAAFWKLGMEIGFDHAFGTNKRDLSTDMWKAAQAALDISVNVPMFPVISLWEASQGRVPPMNVFGSEGYKMRADPFDQLYGMSESIERYMRILGGGLGNAGGAFFAAYGHTKDGFASAVANGLTEVAKTQGSRLPIVRNVLDIQPKLSARNKITEEFYEQMKDINKLVDYYKRFDVNSGTIQTRDKSVKGGEIATGWFGRKLPAEIPGVAQPPPENPLYIKLMEDIYARFKKDNPGYDSKGNEVGGIGFLSILARHAAATKMLHTMYHVDDGLHGSWQQQLSQRTETLADMKAHNVDPESKRQVSNYYERVRQETTTVLYYYIRAVLKEMSNKAGKTVTLKDIDPTGKALAGPEAPFAFPEVLGAAGFP